MHSMTDPPVNVTGGVDTHADIHVAAAVCSTTHRLLDTESFPATPAGYVKLLAWLVSFGLLAAVGIEGTGTYGAGLARFLTAEGVTLVEVDRPTVRPAASTASPIRSMPKRRPGRCSRAGRPAPQRPATDHRSDPGTAGRVPLGGPGSHRGDQPVCMLGVHISVAVNWQHISAGDWTRYAADISRRPSPTAP